MRESSEWSLKAFSVDYCNKLWFWSLQNHNLLQQSIGAPPSEKCVGHSVSLTESRLYCLSRTVANEVHFNSLLEVVRIHYSRWVDQRKLNISGKRFCWLYFGNRVDWIVYRNQSMPTSMCMGSNFRTEYAFSWFKINKPTKSSVKSMFLWCSENCCASLWVCELWDQRTWDHTSIISLFMFTSLRSMKVPVSEMETETICRLL